MTNSRVNAPQSLIPARAERGPFPISPSESPYEYVEALRVAQGGRCACGKHDQVETRDEALQRVADAISEQVKADARAEIARRLALITERK